MIKKIFRTISTYFAHLSQAKVIDADYFERLLSLARMGFKLPVINEISSSRQADLINLLIKSNSQIGADLICLHQLNYKENGYFVEFGAYDGIDHSNTLLLESEFNWTGLLVEPCKRVNEQLRINRPQCLIDGSCITGKSNTNVEFIDCTDGELSTQKKYLKRGSVSNRRIKNTSYEVPTLSLIDLLDKYCAPAHIDFLSIDVEGGELEILKAFNFERYTFSMIAIEHGWTDSEAKIDKILSENGYKRKFKNLSKIDAWYFLES